MNLLPWLPMLAPLAEDQVRSLLIYRETLLPRGPRSRPRHGSPDKLTRIEQRSQQALESLLIDITPAREHIFELLNQLIRAGQLNRRELLDILYPSPQTPYAERLNDWAREGYLWFDKQGNPAPQPTAAILIQRELDPRKRKLPPKRVLPQSFYVWRQETADQPPIAYELPLVLQEVRGPYGIYGMQLLPGPVSYLLWTPWRGIGWNDQAWLITDKGAICWVGEPTREQLASWLTPLQLQGIRSNNASPADLAKLALPILAAARL